MARIRLTPISSGTVIWSSGHVQCGYTSHSNLLPRSTPGKNSAAFPSTNVQPVAPTVYQSWPSSDPCSTNLCSVKLLRVAASPSNFHPSTLTLRSKVKYSDAWSTETCVGSTSSRHPLCLSLRVCIAGRNGSFRRLISLPLTGDVALLFVCVETSSAVKRNILPFCAHPLLIVTIARTEKKSWAIAMAKSTSWKRPRYTIRNTGELWHCSLRNCTSTFLSRSSPGWLVRIW